MSDQPYTPVEDTDFSAQVNEIAGIADGSVDVIIYTDEDVYGRRHETYRLMSARAVAAVNVIEVEEI